MWGFRSPAPSTTSRDRLNASLLSRGTIDMNREASSNFVPDMRNFDHIAIVCVMRAHLIQKRECVEEMTG